jgi:hypothetical protein
MDGERLAKQLSEQWRLVKQAPIPYAAGLASLAIVMFLCFQWGYQRILEQKDSLAATLNTRITSLEDERNDLKSKLDELAVTRPPSQDKRDPDAIYQLGEMVARAPAGQIDRANGKVSFRSVLGGSNFDVRALMEYRQFMLSACTYDMAGEQGSFGVTISVAYSNLTCQISGLHP